MVRGSMPSTRRRAADVDAEIVFGADVRAIDQDPAGATVTIADGDAYRAGLLFGITNGWSWETTGRLASLLGAIKIAHKGAQNHVLSKDIYLALRKNELAQFALRSAQRRYIRNNISLQS